VVRVAVASAPGSWRLASGFCGHKIQSVRYRNPDPAQTPPISGAYQSRMRFGNCSKLSKYEYVHDPKMSRRSTSTRGSIRDLGGALYVVDVHSDFFKKFEAKKSLYLYCSLEKPHLSIDGS
jgi:hypothetical protein